jgi:hypothetical protein
MKKTKNGSLLALLPHIRVPLMKQNISSQDEGLEIAMKLKSSPMGESSSGMS